MRRIFFILVILYATNVHAEQVRYTNIGNTIYGSDGSRLSRIGNTYYSNDGTSYNKIGNTVYGSDGSRSTRIGNTQYVDRPYNASLGYVPSTTSNYDSGSSDAAVVAATAVGAIALGALIGTAISNHNTEVERQYYNHLINFEKKVMTKRVY